MDSLPSVEKELDTAHEPASLLTFLWVGFEGNRREH